MLHMLAVVSEFPLSLLTPIIIVQLFQGPEQSRTLYKVKSEEHKKNKVLQDKGINRRGILSYKNRLKTAVQVKIFGS